jgi:hypothetical protein
MSILGEDEQVRNYGDGMKRSLPCVGCAAAIFLFGGALRAEPIVYSVNLSGLGLNNESITGTIETDGTIGTLGANNILGWNLLLSVGSGQSFAINPGNSNVTITGTATTATANLLQFNYDTPNDGALGYFEILDATAGWGMVFAVPPNELPILAAGRAGCCPLVRSRSRSGRHFRPPTPSPFPTPT